MIFDEGYDKSLWLILSGDKDNRERIIQFIKSIPLNFLINIRGKIVDYNNYILDDDPNKKRKLFNGQYYDDTGCLYSFNIDIDSGLLSIGKSSNYNGVLFPDLEILLFKYAYAYGLDVFEKVSIGGISFDYEKIKDVDRVYLGGCTEIKYDLMRVYNGCMLLSSNKDLTYCRTKFNKVNVRDIPSEVKIVDLDSSKFNKLVRRKNKVTRKDKYDI